MRAPTLCLVLTACALGLTAPARAQSPTPMSTTPVLTTVDHSPTSEDRCANKYRDAARLLQEAANQLKQDAQRDGTTTLREQELIDKVERMANRVADLQTDNSNEQQVRQDLQQLINDLRGTDASSRAIKLMRKALEALDCK